MSGLLIVGAKGFAKELLESALKLRPDRKITFFDDVSTDLPDRLYGRFEVIRSFELISDYFTAKGRNFALGVGSPSLRQRFFKEMIDRGGIPETIVDPDARVGSFGTSIGDGTCIMAGTKITNDISIGKGCLINLNVTIGHDSHIGDFCEMSPGVHISGNVHLGDACNLGTGAVVLPKVKLGDDVTVGAGAVVTKDVASGVTVKGVPAR